MESAGGRRGLWNVFSPGTLGAEVNLFLLFVGKWLEKAGAGGMLSYLSVLADTG